MAVSGAISSQGTLLQLTDGEVAPTWTSIAEVKSIAGPTLKRETVDVTHLNSDGGAREFIPTFIDGGEVTIEANLLMDGSTAIPGSQKDLFAKINDETDAGTKKTADIIRSYRLVLFDAAVLANRSRLNFDAICTGFDPKIGDGAMSLSVTFRIVGKPIFTAAI